MPGRALLAIGVAFWHGNCGVSRQPMSIDPRLAAIMNSLKLELDRWNVPVLSAHHWQGNSALEWLVAAGVLLGVALVARMIKGVVTARLRRVAARTLTKRDDAWVRVLDSTAWFSYLALGVSFARLLITLKPGASAVVSGTTFVLLGIQVAFWAQAVLNVLLEGWTEKQGTARSATAAGATRFIGRLVIWSALTLVVLSNLGIELTTIIAGLGVGGVAAALAVQSLLGDLFAGLSMYFDRPFDIGEFIIVGDVMGNVTSIGLRTTKIDSLGGEKIVYPNGELAKRYVRNYARMKERRILFEVGVEYGVEPAKLERARSILREEVERQENVRFDRVHFKELGEYALKFEIVYYVLSGDYNLYMDKQHAINMAVFRRFADEQIPFAFPTRTIYTRSEGGSGDEPRPPREAPKGADAREAS